MQRLTAKDATRIYYDNFNAKKAQFDLEHRAEINDLIDQIDDRVTENAANLRMNVILYKDDFEYMFKHKLSDIDFRFLVSILKDYYKKQGFHLSMLIDNLYLGWDNDLPDSKFKDCQKACQPYTDKAAEALRAKIRRQANAAKDLDDDVFAKKLQKKIKNAERSPHYDLNKVFDNSHSSNKNLH